jgi:hypothetical protein
MGFEDIYQGSHGAIILHINRDFNTKAFSFRIKAVNEHGAGIFSDTLTIDIKLLND